MEQLNVTMVLHSQVLSKSCRKKKKQYVQAKQFLMVLKLITRHKLF